MEIHRGSLGTDKVGGLHVVAGKLAAAFFIATDHVHLQFANGVFQGDDGVFDIVLGTQEAFLFAADCDKDDTAFGFQRCSQAIARAAANKEVVPEPSSSAPLLISPEGEIPMWSRWEPQITTSFLSLGSRPSMMPMTLGALMIS